MARVWGLVLLALLSSAWTWNSAILYGSLAEIISVRHKLQVDPDALRLQICKGKGVHEARLEWNEGGRWVNVCLSRKKTGTLQRIWRISRLLNYRMLFLPEVPITFAIVIKR